MDASLQAGAHIGAFSLIRPLGAGGAAEVWLANDETLARQVALKIARSCDVPSRDRFLAEARALSTVRHPRIVPVWAFGIDDATGRPFFVLPVMAATLASRLGEMERLPETEVATLGLALVDALSALHAAGLVHRDLKPANILLDEDGAPLLADPGPSGGGTRSWAAPEQLAGLAATPATDFHALGLLLYRALTGGLPPPAGVLPPEIEPPPGVLPADLRPKPARGWESLLVALLRPDPARRLANAAKVRQNLLHLLRAARIRTAFRRCMRYAIPVAALLVLIGMAVRVASVQHPPALAPASPPAPEMAPSADDALRREREWCRQFANALRPYADRALEKPFIAKDGRIVIPSGRLLLLGDLDACPSVPTPTVVLDGGQMILGISAEKLRKRIAELDAFASGAAEHPPSATPREKVRRVACRIVVTDNGGHLGALDLEAREAEQYHMLGALHPAPGATNATLDVYGFSEITLDWHALGPGLRITGCGQIANLTPPGRGTRHRWFDYDDPL